jgi:hypothetical protein
MDVEFRKALFAAEDRQRTVDLLIRYGNQYGVALDDPELPDHIMRLTRGPCLLTAQVEMAAMQAAACPCWPC